MKKIVLITGFTGMDGSNLTKYLLENTDCLIYGMARRSANPNFKNVEPYLTNERVKLIYGDSTDYLSIEKIVKDTKPDYIFNLSANSFVGISWDMPVQVFETNVLGCLYCLEAIRRNKPDCRLYQASSSEMFGEVINSPQDIDHPLRPQSPYGASKCASHLLVRVYRKSYKLFAVSGILYNHTQVNRGPEFVSAKCAIGVARIRKALDEGKLFEPIHLGNVNAERDWSDSNDFVEGMWLMLNQDKIRTDWDGIPKDYVLASGETHSIREFVELAFEAAGIKGNWTKTVNPLDELFISSQEEVLVKIDPKFFRPAEVVHLLGNSTPARTELGWKPKTSFKQLVEKMVIYNLEQLS